LYDNFLAASSRSTVETAPTPNPVVEGMDSARFFKLCKDGHLFNRSFRTNDVDIVFANYRINGTEYKKLFCANESDVVVNERKLKGQRRMDYKGFKAALSNVASRREEDFESMVRKLIDTTAGAPSISGTEALPNRFHDDERTFTGVCKQGGPTMVDREKMTMEQLTDRFKKATVRGTPLHVALGPGINQQFYNQDGDNNNNVLGSYGGSGADHHFMPPAAPAYGSDRHSQVNLVKPLEENTIIGVRSHADDNIRDDAKVAMRGVYEEYAKMSRGFSSSASKASTTPGGPEDGVDSSRLLKLCNEAMLFGKLFRTNDVDIIFTRNKREGGRKLAFDGFMHALYEVSIKKNVTFMELLDQVFATTSGGASSSSSFVASASKLNQSSDFYSSTPATPLAEDVSSPDLEVPPEHEGELQRVFEEYALLSRSIKDRAGAVGGTGGLTVDDGIDSSRFLKLCSDCELFDVMFRLQDIDIVFTKCKAAGARKLSLDAFVAALAEICKKKRTSMHALLDKVSFATSVGGPMM